MADYTGSFSGSFEGTFLGGVVSSSAQLSINWNSGVITNKPTTISPFQANSIISNNRFRENTYPVISASVSTRLTYVESEVGAFISGNVSPGTVSSSQQIADLGYLTSASAAALGFGSGGGTTTDISALNLFTASAQTSIDALNAATSSYLTEVPSGTVSSSTQITNVITDAYISASAAASGFGAGGGETYTAGLGISISGNVITLDTSSTHFRLGVSGAAASYGFGSGGGSFGDPPVIDSHGFEIAEFTGSGALVGTLVATDPTPGDTQTWATQSAYTAGFFSVSTDGVVRTILTSSTAMNTDNTPTSGSHPLLVQVTDGQNNTVEKTIYIRVIPNSAPVFRIGGVGGNTITSFTASLDESSSAATKTQYRIYVTDADSDTITIRTGSLGTDHFSLTIGTTGVSKYVDLVQVTGSLDYENQTSYSFVLTASDAKYEAGYNTPAITYLPYRIEVVDNLGPGIQDQSISGVNENSSDGASAGSIIATDNSNPANTVLYKNFTLVSAYLDGVGTNITSSMGGTSLYDPTADAFQMNIAGAVTRNSSVFLNSDIANRYVYRAIVSDAYNADTASALITIPIADDAVSAISPASPDTFYTLESSIQGDNLTTNSNGYTITNVTLTSGVSQRWIVNTVPSGFVRFANNTSTAYTGSSVTIEVDSNISSSAYVGGNTIAIQITASEHGFETTKQYQDYTLSIVENSAPVGTYSPTSANLNTNGARSGNTLYTLTWTDTESDSLNHSTFTLTSDASITSSWNGGYVYTITATDSLADGTYYISASIKDEHGFRIGYKNQTMTIAQADTGSLTTNEPFYVIESATSGAFVYTSTNGRTGTRGSLGVTYSPQYNSAAVQSFTSSNALVGVTKGGFLSVGNVSGSGFTFDAGTAITSNITWRDQYDNIGGPTQISINVAINSAPSVTFTNAGSTVLNTNAARSASNPTLSTITFSDAESDSLNHDTFTFTDPSGQLSASRSGDSWLVKPITNLSASVYQMTASIKDIHGFRVGTANNTFDIIKAKIGSFSQPSLYIIESAISGAGVTTESDGSGSAYTLSVSYSPNYGSQIATNFSASGDAGYVYVHPTTGVVTIYNDLSGSAVQNGSSLTPTITWNDQYGNLGSQSLSVSVVDNQAATATFTDLTANWVGNPVASDVGLVSASITDPEVQIVSMSLGGTDAGSLIAVPQNFDSSSYVIKSATTLTPATYYYSASIHDSYGNTTSYNRSIVVTAPTSNPQLYIYLANHGSSVALGSSYLAVMGASTVNGNTPPQVTALTATSGSFFKQLVEGGKLGSTGLILPGAKVGNLVATATATGSVEDIVENIGQFAASLTGQLIVVFPSGSVELNPLPTSMTDAYAGSVLNQYVMQVQTDGGGWANTTEASTIHEIVLNSAVDGYTDWFVIGRTGYNTISSNAEIRIRPASGSAQV